MGLSSGTFAQAYVEAVIWVTSMVLLLIRLRIHYKGGHCSVQTDLAGRTVVITGAAQGIGKVTMEELLKRGCQIVFGDRDRTLSEETLKELNSEHQGRVHYRHLDLADYGSIRNFVEQVSKLFQKIDVLVNNAGVMGMRTRTLTPNGIEVQLAVNYIGHFYLTRLLLAHLQLSDRPRICNLASMAYSRVVHSRQKVVIDLENMNWQDAKIPYDEDMAYSRSKLAIVLSTVHLAEKLKKQCPAMKVVSLHPGAVRTNLAKNHHLACGIYYIFHMMTYPIYWILTKDVREGAQTSLYTIFEETDKLTNGGYYADCEQQPIDSESNTPEIREKLWKWTCKQLGLQQSLATAH